MNSLIRILFLCLSLAVFPAAAAPGKITPESLRVTESKIQKLSSEVLPAVVSLIPDGRVPRMGTGSAVIVDKDGLILTAAHVAVEMGDKVTVIFADGSRASAEVLGMDFSRDAAMLQIVGEKREFPFVELGDSKSLVENDWCVALGHAGGFQADRTAPIRLGRVIKNDEEEFLLSDCALIGGDSGGPLFDLEGKLIGIHSNIGFSLSENRHVPISVFSSEWDRMKNSERFGGTHMGGFLENPYRPMMGAALNDPKGGKGSIVMDVVPGAPADKAGLGAGDRIVQVAGKNIKDTDALLEAIGNKSAGDTLELLVKKNGESRTVSVSLVAAKKLGAYGQTSPRDSLAPRLRSQKKKPEPKPDITPETKEEREKLQAEFNKRLRDSIEGGRLELELDEIQKFGGPEQFGELMRNFRDSLSEQETEDLMRMLQKGPEVKPRSFDPDAKFELSEEFFREVLDAYHPSIAQASEATHPVFRGTEWKALCTVVHEDGFAITKASEIETKNNQKLNVLISKDELISAKVVKTFPDLDLALLELDVDQKLTPIQWTSTRKDLPLGSFIAAAGSGPDALAIGVISVEPRTMSAHKKGFLGIGTAADSKGVKVTLVMPKASASAAGVRSGDIITSIDDNSVRTPEQLIKAISGTVPGSVVKVDYLRNGDASTKQIKLGDRSKLDSGMPDRNGRMNTFGTEVSKRATGYETVIQTDLPIQPEYCGGPVVDLDGKLVGFNIARAGRIKTYAIPADLVKKAVDSALPTLLKSHSKTGSDSKEKPNSKPEVKDGAKPVRA